LLHNPSLSRAAFHVSLTSPTSHIDARLFEGLQLNLDAHSLHVVMSLSPVMLVMLVMLTTLPSCVEAGVAFMAFSF
jgi:hypothetical protein